VAFSLFFVDFDEKRHVHWVRLALIMNLRMVNMPLNGIKALIASSFVLFLVGCQTSPSVSAKDELTFVDSQSFDESMAASLRSNKSPVTIDFYSPVAPNAIPPRIDKWMAMAQKSGGKISVTQPEGEPTPKSPMLLLGLFTGLWEVIGKLSKEKTSYSMEDSVKNRNVNISLARNPQGNLYVNKIIFEPITAK